MGPRDEGAYGQYLWAVYRVLQGTDASVRSWRTAGRRVRLPGGVPYRFAGLPVVGPMSLTVTLQIRDEDWRAVAGLDERLAMAAGSPFARVYRDLALVRVEFSLPEAQWREVRLAELPPARSGGVPIGLTALGRPARVSWDPPHKAMFGSTRSGKTTCLAAATLNLAGQSPAELRLLIINPKNDPALRPFARLPHLAAPVAANFDDATALLRFALGEMHRRVDAAGYYPRWVVIVDEVAQLVEENPTAGAIITQLSQMAGGLGINLLVASQAANPKVFGDKGSLARANFTSRLVFQLPRDQSYLATGLDGQHTERLNGKGDALAVLGDRVTRFRAALPAPGDYARLPLAEHEPDWPDGERLAGDRAIGERWQVPPEMLVYALRVRGSATQIQKRFGGAMSRAQTVRDYAVEFKAAVLRPTAPLPEVGAGGIVGGSVGSRG